MTKMRLPRGFGKNYFTLSAITATVNQASVNTTSSRVRSFHLLSVQGQESESELEEEELLVVCPLQLSKKPCHCNCYFLKKTRKTLKLFFNPKLFFNYFKTLNNSISPPFLLRQSY